MNAATRMYGGARFCDHVVVVRKIEKWVDLLFQQHWSNHKESMSVSRATSLILVI